MTDLDRLLSVLRSCRFSFSDERSLQDGIAALFDAMAIAHTREEKLSPRDRIDFVVGRVGVEVKIEGQLTSLLRQCARYLEHDRIDALIIVTNLRRLARLPPELCGKPLRVHLLPAF